MVEIESYVSLKYHSAIAIGDCGKKCILRTKFLYENKPGYLIKLKVQLSDLEGYLNSCCIITVVCMTVALVSFLLGSVIYIGWWREDLWKAQLTKPGFHIYFSLINEE